MNLNISNEDYHNTKGISSSDFRLLERSPKHLENKELFKLQGSSFLLGTLVHKMVLEPDTLDNEFIEESFRGADISFDTKAYREALPLIKAMRDGNYSDFIEEVFEHQDANKNSKIFKEAKQKFEEHANNHLKVIVPQDIWRIAEDITGIENIVGERTRISKSMWKQAEDMAHNVMVIAGDLLSNGIAEESFFVEDEEFGITRKCRPDYQRRAIKTVLDLKTTNEGDSHSFAKSISKFSYHRQAAWYLDTLNMAGLNFHKFVFITVESNYPYMVDILEIDQDSIQIGRDEYRKYLFIDKHYKDIGFCENFVKPVSLPGWHRDE